MKQPKREVKVTGTIVSVKTDSFSYIEVFNKYDPREVLNKPGVGRQERRVKAHHLYIELDNGKVIAIARKNAARDRFREKYDYVAFSDTLFSSNYKIGNTIELSIHTSMFGHKRVEEVQLKRGS